MGGGKKKKKRRDADDGVRDAAEDVDTVVRNAIKRQRKKKRR